MSITYAGDADSYPTSVDLPENGEPLDADEITDDIAAMADRTAYIKSKFNVQHRSDDGTHRAITVTSDDPEQVKIQITGMISDPDTQKHFVVSDSDSEEIFSVREDGLVGVNGTLLVHTMDVEGVLTDHEERLDLLESNVASGKWYSCSAVQTFPYDASFNWAQFDLYGNLGSKGGADYTTAVGNIDLSIPTTAINATGLTLRVYIAAGAAANCEIIVTIQKSSGAGGWSNIVSLTADKSKGEGFQEFWCEWTDVIEGLPYKAKVKFDNGGASDNQINFHALFVGFNEKALPLV